jgi:sugar phosphate isomerase/epimerase
VKLSLSEITTVNASYREDLEAYAAAGFDGIGIWESKLSGDDEADLAALRASGLSVANCVPAAPSILPIPDAIPGPDDPEERIRALCASVRRLAAYEPESVLCLTGPAGSLSEGHARRIAIEGLKRVAAAAEEAGVRLGLEPIHVSQREILTLVTSIPEALDLLDDAGLPGVGVMLDTYHVWDTPTIFADILVEIDRITGVHVGDRPGEPERTDRVLPGEGSSRTQELVVALERAGWKGFYDVEIFSEPERLWALPADEVARRCYAAMRNLIPG